jgi:hypothetical protein
LFIYSSADRCVHCFHILVIVNVVNLYLLVELLSQITNLCLTYGGISKLICITIVTFLHSQQQCMKIPNFSTSSTNLISVSFFSLVYNNHLENVKCYVMVWFAFPYWLIEHSFMHLLANCISDLEKYLCKYFIHFPLGIVFLLSCKSSSGC